MRRNAELSMVGLVSRAHIVKLRLPVTIGAVGLDISVHSIIRDIRKSQGPLLKRHFAHWGEGFAAIGEVVQAAQAAATDPLPEIDIARALLQQIWHHDDTLYGFHLLLEGRRENGMDGFAIIAVSQ